MVPDSSLKICYRITIFIDMKRNKNEITIFRQIANISVLRGFITRYSLLLRLTILYLERYI